MLATVKKWLRGDAEVIADAEADTASAGIVPVFVLQARHESLVKRAKASGLDPNTVLLLIQVFGPLLVKLIERWLARHRTTP